MAFPSRFFSLFAYSTSIWHVHTETMTLCWWHNATLGTRLTMRGTRTKREPSIRWPLAANDLLADNMNMWPNETKAQQKGQWKVIRSHMRSNMHTPDELLLRAVTIYCTTGPLHDEEAAT